MSPSRAPPGDAINRCRDAVDAIQSATSHKYSRDRTELVHLLGSPHIQVSDGWLDCITFCFTLNTSSTKRFYCHHHISCMKPVKQNTREMKLWSTKLLITWGFQVTGKNVQKWFITFCIPPVIFLFPVSFQVREKFCAMHKKTKFIAFTLGSLISS